MKPIILVVEDDKQIAYNIKIILDFNDYDPVMTNDGEEAIDFLKNKINKPHLIISDIMMPKMDGYKLYQKISENDTWSQIPFIFLTAKAHPDEEQVAQKLGIYDYVKKPFEEDELLKIISKKLKKNG